MSRDNEAGRHKHLMWTYNSREPRAHREWCELRSILRSFPRHSAFYAIQSMERRAYARWMAALFLLALLT
jgi:hypothetical protein